MKKWLSVVCAFAIILIASIGGGTYANAGTYEEECDTVFFKAFEKVLEEESITSENITITKESVYDLELEQLGYIYFINIGESNGFAFVINTNGMFDLTEIYLNAENPFKGYSGQKIYVKLMTYLVYENGIFLEPESGLELNGTMLDLLQDSALYSSDYVFSNREETIYYSNRTENKIELAKNYPGCYPLNISNGCTPAAGGNIIQYYTRYFPELIPGFSPGSALGNFYIYKEMTSNMTPIIETLYYYMETNVVAPGTSIAGFRNGMTRFSNEKGRNISFSTCMQNGSFNYEIAKQRFADGKPLVLFVDIFTVATFYKSSNSDLIDYLIGNACHAMAGFGYNEITYTLTNGQIRTDKYIAVATGLINQTKGYYNVNYNTQIDEAYSINIY